MANTYTKDEISLSSKIFFLNGQNIVHDLESDNQINPIPSLKLLSQVSGNLSGYIDAKIEKLSTNYTNNENQIINTISQEDGKLSVTFKDIVSSDVKHLSNYVTTKIYDNVRDISTTIDTTDGNIITKLKQENGIVSIVSQRALSSSDIVGLEQTVDDKINTLDSSVSAEEGEFLTCVEQKNGKLVSSNSAKIKDSNIEGTLSQSKITNLTTDLANISAAYAKKSGDYIEWISTKDISVVNVYADTGTVFDVGFDGIKANLKGLNKKIEISSLNGLGDVIVNGTSIENTLTSLSSGTYEKSRTYTDEEIGKLSGSKDVSDAVITKISWNNGQISEIDARELSSVDVVDLNQTITNKINALNSDTVSADSEFIFAVKEENGIVRAEHRSIRNSDISEGLITQNKICGLVTDLNNISSEYLLTSDFNSRLSSSFSNESGSESFGYDKTSKELYLDVQGKKMTIKLSDVIGTKIVKEVQVIESETTGDKYLRIIFDTDPESSVDIKISELAQVYHGVNGITINSDLYISADSTIARQSSINAMNRSFVLDKHIITGISQDNGVLSVSSEPLQISHVNGLVSDIEFLSTHYVRNDIDGEIKANLKTENISSDEIMVYQKNPGNDAYTLFSVGQDGLKYSSTGTFRNIQIQLDDGLNNISVNGYSISSYIDDRAEKAKIDSDSNTDLKLGSLRYEKADIASRKRISSISQTSGLISVETTDLLSSDIVDLDKYVQNEINLSANAVSVSLNSSLSITVELSDTSPKGVVSAYVIKQGGSQSGCAIQIPSATEYSVVSNGLSIENNTIGLKIGNNLTFDLSGRLSANEGRIYKAGNGLSVSDGGVFSVSAVYNSIWIDDQIRGNKGYSDLSIFKIPLSDYELSVAASSVISNGLYITESDYIDAYGQQICCLTMSDTEQKYEGIAATDTYVREMTKSDRICAEIHLSDFAYKTQQDGIKNSLTSAVQDISSILFKKETTDEINLEQIVQALSVLCNRLNSI